MKARLLDDSCMFHEGLLELGRVYDVITRDGLIRHKSIDATLGEEGKEWELIDEESRAAKVAAQSHHIGEGNVDLLADAVNASEGYPDNNPKAAIGSTKCPLHLVPPALAIGVAEAMKNGADKYGAFNFRDSKIAASVYTGAILRHLYAYMDGEDNASDSGIHHLKHIGASIALMLDSMAAGTYDDDRPTKGGAAKLLEEYNAT